MRNLPRFLSLQIAPAHEVIPSPTLCFISALVDLLANQPLCVCMCMYVCVCIYIYICVCVCADSCTLYLGSKGLADHIHVLESTEPVVEDLSFLYLHRA